MTRKKERVPASLFFTCSPIFLYFSYYPSNLLRIKKIIIRANKVYVLCSILSPKFGKGEQATLLVN